MKVIGTANDNNYIVSVSHSELEKCFAKYYNKLERLKIGEEIDLGMGYDYHSKIVEVCSGMVEATKRFEASQKATLAMSRAIVKAVKLP